MNAWLGVKTPLGTRNRAILELALKGDLITGHGGEAQNPADAGLESGMGL